MANTEEQIRSIVEDRISALRARDAKRFLGHMEGGFSSFELGPPLQYLDNDPSNTEGLDLWFSSYKGDVAYAIRDLRIVVGDPVSYCHSLYHIKGKKKDGEKVDMWTRLTLCFRRGTDGLKISHTHTSVPFNMDGDHEAAIDLKP